jgi:hypothetical protein
MTAKLKAGSSQKGLRMLGLICRAAPVLGDPPGSGVQQESGFDISQVENFLLRSLWMCMVGQYATAHYLFNRKYGLFCFDPHSIHNETKTVGMAFISSTSSR